MMRKRMREWIETANTNPIRKQRFREHYLPVGKPHQLYNYWKGGGYFEGLHIPTLEWLESLVDSIDSDRFLPDETMIFCENICVANGFSSELMATMPFNKTSPHKAVYMNLRYQLQVFVAGGGVLREETTPVGAEDWIKAHQQQEEAEEIRRQHEGILHLRELDPINNLAEADYEDADVAEGVHDGANEHELEIWDQMSGDESD